MNGLFLDLKHAVRSIAAAPRFAATVIVTLALGIGANTAVFSVLNRVVLTPLRYEDPERLVRVYVESLLLSVAGGIAGCLVAPAVTRVLLAAAPATVAQAGNGSLERAVLAFSAGIALLAGLVFGVAPAAQVARTDLEGLLRESGRTGSGSRRQTRARNALVVCQVALALVLLVGAGLLLRSFDRLRAVALGVRPSRVMTFAVNLPGGRYPDAEQRARFHRDFQARLSALPGVRAAAAISWLPVTGTYHSWGVRRTDLSAGVAHDAGPATCDRGAVFRRGGDSAPAGTDVQRGRRYQRAAARGHQSGARTAGVSFGESGRTTAAGRRRAGRDHRRGR